MLKPIKNSICKNALSVWCQVDTDIVFLIILIGYQACLLQTVENNVFAPNLQLPRIFFTVTNNDSICKKP